MKRKASLSFRFAFITFVLAGSGLVVAQTSSPTPAPNSSPKVVEAPPASSTPSPVQSPKVISVEGHLELDVVVRVEVDNLSEWAQTNNPSKLVLYLNGLALRGNYPEEIHASKNHLHFHLKITPENKSVWVDLLGAPEGARTPVTFSVGLEDMLPGWRLLLQPGQAR